MYNIINMQSIWSSLICFFIKYSTKTRDTVKESAKLLKVDLLIEQEDTDNVEIGQTIIPAQQVTDYNFNRFCNFVSICRILIVTIYCFI